MKNNLRENKPVLLFDGDCGFCGRWADRWRVLTDDKVLIKPFQSCAEEFPEVSLSDFSKSVYLFEADRTSRGAEAIFRLRALNPKNRLGLFLYNKVAIFRVISEFLYSIIAGNRGFFSLLTQWFWGNDPRPDSYYISRKIFFRGLGLVYAAAFASLGVQVTGLLGTNGILPVRELLPAVLKHFHSFIFSLYHFPSLFWFRADDLFLQAVCVAAVALSVILFSGFAMRTCLFLLWLLYLSFVSVGQDFLSFQWDTLLLETGFLALFWAPSQKGFLKTADWESEPISFSRGLLLFLLIKLMISSGLVKLASGDPVWRNFSALQYHFETQPLPNPLSWFAHQIPARIHKLSVFFMFLIEISAPFFLLFPRTFRRAAALALIFLQGLILMTGNYGFFNLLAIILCVVSLDDLFWTSAMKNIRPRKQPAIFWKVIICPVLLLSLAIGTNQIARIVSIQLPWSTEAAKFEILLNPFLSINNYGLFAVMTTKRPEIIVEGSDDGSHWKNYEFKFKPGILTSRPSWTAPFQPRLDWQMWFAALSSAESQRWFMNFCTRLLQGGPEVLKLLSRNPFQAKPPRYIRASLYQYHFTNVDERRLNHQWWKRDYLGLYLPPVSLQAADVSASRES